MKDVILSSTFDACLSMLSQNSSVPLLPTEEDVKQCVDAAAEAVERTPMSILEGNFLLRCKQIPSSQGAGHVRVSRDGYKCAGGCTSQYPKM